MKKMLFAVLAALLSFEAAGQLLAAAQDRNCPLTAEQIETHKSRQMADRRATRPASALVGVDALGRVLMALDYDRDEMVDELVLFTPRHRLEGPWSERIHAANVDGTAGTLRLEARDGSLAILLAVFPADVPELASKSAHRFKRVIREADGDELVRTKLDPASGRRLESFDHTLIESWPESFRRELNVPGTSGPLSCYNCGTYNCRVGGCYSSGCAVDCFGLLLNSPCQVSCNPSRSFSCCNCTNGIVLPIAECRCIACWRVIGPIP